MASLDQIKGNFARGPNGEYVVRRPGAGWARVSEEEYNALRQSRGERVLGAAGDFIQDSVGGLMSMAPALMPGGALAQNLLGDRDPTSAVGRFIMESNDPRQAARAEADPLANLAGNVIGFGAELAIPGPPLASRAGRAATAGARIGADAAEAGVRRAVETGGAVAGRVGDATMQAARRIPMVGDEVQGVATSLARRAENRSINAAQNTGKPRFRAGIMSSDEFKDALGTDLATTRSIDGFLDATNPADSNTMRAIIKEQALRERTDPTITETLFSGQRESLRETTMNLREGVNRAFMRKIGADDTLFPDVDTIGDRLTEISGGITNIGKNITDPFDGRALMDDIDEIAREQLTDRADRAIDKVKRDIEALGEQIDPQQMSIVRNRLEQDIRRMASSQPDVEVVEVLNQVRDRIRQQMIARMSPEDIAAEKELRQQWGAAMNALTRQAALGEEGLNPRSYLAARGQKDRLTKTGRRDDEFTKLLRTADAILQVIPKSSQTPEALSRMTP